MLDGKIDRLSEVGVVYFWQDRSKNIRVHLCLVLCFKVLMTKKTLHPIQRHKDCCCRTWDYSHDTRNKHL